MKTITLLIVFSLLSFVGCSDSSTKTEQPANQNEFEYESLTHKTMPTPSQTKVTDEMIYSSALNSSCLQVNVTTGAEIQVFPCVGAYINKDILRLEDVHIKTVTCEKDYNALQYSTKVGDPCVVVSGKIRNESDNSCWVSHSAYGYDINGNLVSGTLDSSHIVGAALIGVSAQSEREFELHMNPSDDLSLIRLSASCYNEPPP